MEALQQVLSQYLEVVALSLAVGRKYVHQLKQSEGGNEEENTVLSYIHEQQSSDNHHQQQQQQHQHRPTTTVSLKLVLATFALAVLLTAIRQLFLRLFSGSPRPRPSRGGGPSQWFSGSSFFPSFPKSSTATFGFGWTVKEGGGGERLGEALYSLLSYAGSFSLAATLVHRNGLLSGDRLDAFWDEDSSEFSASSSLLVTALYAYECAHYLSSLAVVLLLKPLSFARWWYSALLTLHHLVALVLLVLSYLPPCSSPGGGDGGGGLRHIGVAVLFLHDLCDILLQLTKALNQLQQQGKQQQGQITTGEAAASGNSSQLPSTTNSNVIQLLRMAVFGAFTATWFAARLYAFPVVVIGSCGRRLLALEVADWPPGAALLYALLHLIALMNAYWACLILGIAARCVLKGGGAEAIEDVREEKVVAEAVGVSEKVKKEKLGKEEEEVHGQSKKVK